MKKFFLAACLSVPALAFTALPGSAYAQTAISGDVSGAITDPTGALVAGAKVTLVSSDKGASQTVTTNASGTFRISLLKPGLYNVTVSHEGFDTVKSTVNVVPGQVAEADFKLTLGASSTNVEVSASEPLLNTENADLSTSFTMQQVQDLPNPGNDLTFVAQTAPGVVMNTQGGYGNFATFGLPATSNTFTVNGGYENDPFLNLNNSGATNLLLGNNDIAQVAVTSNAYSAQFGGLGAAQINEISRSGSNRFHGDATYWWNGSVLNGNDYFNNQSGARRPRSNANQWAGSIGGPIYKDKTFFFFNTEGLRVIIPVANNVWAPSQSFIATTEANVTAAYGAAALPLYQSFFGEYTKNPSYATAQPGTITDANGNVIPDPDSVTFRAQGANFAHEWLITSRVDQVLGSKDNMFIHAKIDKGVQPTFTSLLDPVFDTNSPQPQYEGQLNETHIFTPNVANQFVFAAIYYRAIFDNTNSKAANAIAPFDLLAFLDGNLANNGANFNVGGIDAFFPQGRNVTGYQFVDDFSVTHGSHNIKVGYSFRRDDVTDYGPQVLTTPLVLSTIESFKAGSADVFVQQFPTRLTQPVSVYTMGFYAQDQWKLSPSFVINYGIRFEHNSNPVCHTSCFATLSSDFSGVSSDPAVAYNKLISSGRNKAFDNFQKVGYEPRVGFSWSPLGANTNTVIRGGFGIFADSFPAQIADNLLNNAPTNVGFTLLGPAITGTTYPLYAGAPGSFSAVANASNQAFVAGYAGGGSFTTLSASVNGFGAPSIVSATKKISYPTYEEFNLQVQQQVGKYSSISASYVGNHGYKEPVLNNSINAFNGGAPGFPTLPTAPPNGNFGAVNQIYSGASSNYNGLVISAINRSKMLTLQANYTYSHALDEVSNGGFNGFSGNSVNPTNPNNLHQNYGNADYDTRHYFSGDYVFNLPYYGGPKILTDGWELTGDFFHSAGLPFTFTDGATSGANFGNYGGALYAKQTTAHIPTKCSGKAATQGVPCAAVADFTTATDFGQSHRNQVFGPSYTDTDMTLTKKFGIPGVKGMEGANLVIGVQAFNLFNHPNFAQPLHDSVDGTSEGTIQSTVNPPTSILGSFLGGDASPRLLQLKAKFSF